MKSRMSEEQWRRDVERCLEEIAEVERLLLRGHPDIEGVCMALADWSVGIEDSPG